MSFDNYINKIKTEIAPFFKFSNSDNPHRIIKKWVDRNYLERTQLIFANCIRCNKQRFSPNSLILFKSRLKSHPKMNSKLLETYFCFNCMQKILKYPKDTVGCWQEYFFKRLGVGHIYINQK